MSYTLPKRVSIYKSTAKKELYLYLRQGSSLASLPAALTAVLGQVVPVMDILLSAERRLARADSAQVLAAIEQQGFYLQMPPADGPPTDVGP